jgi:hypothetical protein
MNMTLHSIPHQNGEYRGLSKPRAQNSDLVEKVDGHRDPSGSNVLHIYLYLYLCKELHGLWRNNLKSQILCGWIITKLIFG